MSGSPSPAEAIAVNRRRTLCSAVNARGAENYFHTCRKRMRAEEKPTSLYQVEADGCDRGKQISCILAFMVTQ